jgi:hypothetical protein
LRALIAGTIKTFRGPLSLGIVSALLLGFAGLSGYGVVIYYCWWIILVFLLLLATSIIKHEPSVTAYLLAVTIMVGLSSAGALGGYWARRLHCYSKCKSCEPILALLEAPRAKQGHYPAKLEEVEGVIAAQRRSGLRLSQGEYSENGIDLAGINTNDALIFLSTNTMWCVVPVTKQLPMSFTRLYVYTWSTDRPSWSYDNLVTHLFVRDDRPQ